jgi:beta-aspartyl-peptidase (threonine type)
LARSADFPIAVTLARAVLESRYAVIVGQGAHRFAREHGLQTCDPAELVSERERRRHEPSSGPERHDWDKIMFGDTVGAAALDAVGHLAAATATGGSLRKPQGRVGGSPWVGCGLYADDATAAVSTTGHGKLLIPLVWAKAAADPVGAGADPHLASYRAVAMLDRWQARGRLNIVEPTGCVGVKWNTPRMAFAFLAADVSTGGGPR